MWGVAEGARRAVPRPVTATAAVLVPVPVPSLSQLLPHPCRCSASVLVPVPATAAVPVSIPLLLSRTICWHYPCFSPCPCPCRRCCPGRSLRSPRLERPRLPAPWRGVSRRRPERGWAGRSPGRAAGSRWARGARGAASACSDRGQQQRDLVPSRDPRARQGWAPQPPTPPPSPPLPAGLTGHPAGTGTFARAPSPSPITGHVLKGRSEHVQSLESTYGFAQIKQVKDTGRRVQSPSCPRHRALTHGGGRR